jgi:hypothetical protein
LAIVPGDIAPLRVLVLVQVALVASASVLVFRILRPRLGLLPALLAALLIVAQPGSPRVLRGGMESSLGLFLLVAIWWSWLRIRDREAAGNGSWLRLGFLCAAAFLTRLEAGAALLVILFLSRRQLRSLPAQAVALVAPSVVCGALYLVWNHHVFGLWLPVSGYVKAHWVAEGGQWHFGTPTQHFLASLSVPWVGERVVRRLFRAPSIYYGAYPGSVFAYAALLALVGLLVWRYRTFWGRVVRESAAGFVLLTAGLMVLADKLVVRDVMEWGEVPIFLVTAVLGGGLVLGRRTLARMAVALAVVSCMWRTAETLWRPPDPEEAWVFYRIRAADWAREHVAASERIGSWGPGMLAYFSHRSVVSLDGLVNDADFLQRVLKPRRLEEYLRTERIDWLVNAACGEHPRLSEILNGRDPRAYLAMSVVDGLERDYQVVKTFYRTDAPAGCPGYGVWKRHPGSGPAAPPEGSTAGGSGG